MTPAGTATRLKSRIVVAIARFAPAYRMLLRRRGAAPRPRRVPAPNVNAVLKTRAEWESAVSSTREAGLHVHEDLPKNWDALACLDFILSRTDRTARVLDAGGEIYSPLVEWLFLWGYTSLDVLNLAFDRPVRRGPIRYVPGDCTASPYGDEAFDVVASLSVIEHGVPLRAFVRECGRIIRRGGYLLVSTDYWPEPMDTSGLKAYGTDVHVFTRAEIEAFIAMAQEEGFELTEPVDLDAQERAVTWDRLSLFYTFVLLAFRRP